MANSLLQRAKQLPDVPGIYLFYNRTGDLVYVGKATSLRQRVTSGYFQGRRTPRPIEDMIHEVVRIDYKMTDSVLEAAILEALCIKKFQPRYNVLGKDDKSWNYIVITKDAFPRVETVRQHELNELQKSGNKEIKKFRYVFGPYPGLNTRAAMKILRRIFKFSTCEPGRGRPCLYYEMGQCLGVCTGEITPAAYKRKVIMPLKWFLSGKKKQVIREFEKQMKLAAKAEDYEEAGRLRDQIRQLQRIHDVTLINKSFFDEQLTISNEQLVMRIEGYDISNLGASGMVGSMVVFDAEGPVKSEYRKFNIKTVVGQSDVDCLGEVLERRLKHADWPMPDVILVDGGRPQVNRAKKILQSKNLKIGLLGIAKGPKRKRNDILLGSLDKKFVHWVYRHQNLLIRVRDEAHRFAITFQRSKRKIK